MKTILAAAAGCLTLGAVTAQAAPAPRGYVDGAYERTRIQMDGVGSADLDISVLEGTVSVPLGDGFGAQLDANVTRYGGDGGNDTVWSPTGHVFIRAGRARIGAFAGLTRGSEDGDESWGAGAEGRFEISPNWRVDGAAGFGKTKGVNEVEQRVGRIELRYFVDDDTRIDAYVDYVNLDSPLGGADGTTLGLGLEHRYGGGISAFGRFEHSEAGDMGLKSDGLRVGLRWNFGGGTLRDRDTEGPYFRGLPDTFGGPAGRLAALLSTLTPTPPPPPPPPGDPWD